MSKVTSVTVSAGGIGWFSMWMFTVAFAHLGAGPAILALVAWPYFLGSVLAGHS